MDVKSIVFLLGGAVVSWKSTKQASISKSTMEVELIALDTTCIEADRLRNLLTELALVRKPLPPMSIHCYNKVAIDLIKQRIQMLK